MGYFDQNLVPDERILFRTKKHVIIYLWAVVWTLFSVVAVEYMYSNPILANLAFLPWILSAFLWAQAWLMYVTSEFAVTNKRVMMREGFFFKHANELRLNTISQINIDQSLLGQWLNYGTITVNSFGGRDAYSLIADPLKFQRVVNEQVV
ncbi:MAG: PH domain-containing protein [Gammaproteobacteria bacterium]